jgi:hypothetical protein
LTPSKLAALSRNGGVSFGKTVPRPHARLAR